MENFPVYDMLNKWSLQTDFANLRFDKRSFGVLSQKRKIDTADQLRPAKLHITEEKMVSQLKGIHLSNEYVSHEAQPTTDSEVEEMIQSKLDTDGSIPSLKVCDEIRALQNTIEPVIPPSLIERFRRPSTAVVLWTPPAGALNFLHAKQESTSSEHSSKDESQPQPSVSSSSDVGDIEMNEEDDNNNGSLNCDRHISLGL